MKPFVRIASLVVALVGLTLPPGCGKPKTTDPKTIQAQLLKAKVNALKQLADAVANNPNSPAAQAAFEEFRNTPFDAKAHPDEAAEIVEIYTKRVQGKFRGELGQELQAEVAGIQRSLKKAK